jgi:DNA phosphorothioation-dependent restriction protein DptG
MLDSGAGDYRIRTDTPVASDIANYLSWVENEYHAKHVSSAGDNDIEDWYSRRLDWLYRLIEEFEVSTALIAQHMRKIHCDKSSSRYGDCDVEDSINHFTQSLAIHEKRQAPRVWGPLGKT